MSQSNYDRLVQSGIINPGAGTNPSAADMKAIESLSSAEVDHLISAKAKLGDTFLSQHGAAGKSLVIF